MAGMPQLSSAQRRDLISHSKYSLHGATDRLAPGGLTTTGSCLRPRATNMTRNNKIGRYRKHLFLEGHEGYLRELIATREGITLAEIRRALVDRGIERCSLTTIWSMLRRLGLPRKKKG